MPLGAAGPGPMPLSHGSPAGRRASAKSGALWPAYAGSRRQAMPWCRHPAYFRLAKLTLAVVAAQPRYTEFAGCRPSRNGQVHPANSVYLCGEALPRRTGRRKLVPPPRRQGPALPVHLPGLAGKIA
jgi:hypothetical protein